MKNRLYTFWSVPKNSPLIGSYYKNLAKAKGTNSHEDNAQQVQRCKTGIHDEMHHQLEYSFQINIYFILEFIYQFLLLSFGLMVFSGVFLEMIGLTFYLPFIYGERNLYSLVIITIILIGSTIFIFLVCKESDIERGKWNVVKNDRGKVDDLLLYDEEKFKEITGSGDRSGFNL